MGRVIKAAPTTLHTVPYAARKQPPEPDEGRMLFVTLLLLALGGAALLLTP